MNISNMLLSFNPRARAGRGLAGLPRLKYKLEFQSTRPRGARHTSRKDESVPPEVSIHAPARGAATYL